MGHGMMFVKKYKMKWVFCEENSKNIPKIKHDFQGNGQI